MGLIWNQEKVWDEATEQGEPPRYSRHESRKFRPIMFKIVLRVDTPILRVSSPTDRSSELLSETSEKHKIKGGAYMEV
jgi:hypothetical protein